MRTYTVKDFTVASILGWLVYYAVACGNQNLR